MTELTSLQLSLLEYLAQLQHTQSVGFDCLFVKAEDVGTYASARFYDQTDALIDERYVEEGTVMGGSHPDLPAVRYILNDGKGGRQLMITSKGLSLLNNRDSIVINDTPMEAVVSIANETVTDLVISFYLNSDDLNGISLKEVGEELSIPSSALRNKVKELIEDSSVTSVSMRTTVNPHIKLSDDVPLNDQLAELANASSSSIYLYPTRSSLQPYAKSISHDRPFTARLLLGEPQLQMVYFEMAVLERYAADPRFLFQFEDVVGSVSIKDNYHDNADTLERDKTYIQWFGLGFNAKDERVVVALLRDLAALTPDHQRHWATHLEPSVCQPHPDFYRSTFNGEFADSHSDYRSFLEVQAKINELMGVIEQRTLFKSTYEESRPEGFGFLLRPTLRNFNAFVLLMDRLLSDNINTHFFRGKLQTDESAKSGEGSGTLSRLKLWLHQKFPSEEHNVRIDNVMKPLLEIRGLRQQPAHTIREDKYDPDYWKQQDDLVRAAYQALYHLQTMLEELADQTTLLRVAPVTSTSIKEDEPEADELPNYLRHPNNEVESQARINSLVEMLDSLMEHLFACSDVRYEDVEANKAVSELTASLNLANQMLEHGDVSLTSSHTPQSDRTEKTIHDLADGSIWLLSIVRNSIEAQLRWLGAQLPEYDEQTRKQIERDDVYGNS